MNIHQCKDFLYKEKKRERERMTERVIRKSHLPQFVSKPFDAGFRVAINITLECQLGRFQRHLFAISLWFHLHLGCSVNPWIQRQIMNNRWYSLTTIYCQGAGSTNYPLKTARPCRPRSLDLQPPSIYGRKPRPTGWRQTTYRQTDELSAISLSNLWIINNHWIIRVHNSSTPSTTTTYIYIVFMFNWLSQPWYAIYQFMWSETLKWNNKYEQ